MALKYWLIAIVSLEPCFMVIGQIAKKYWSAIVTYRNRNIRLISVRRSRDDEIEFYES